LHQLPAGGLHVAPARTTHGNQLAPARK
jgi:hypothetical protein